MRRGCALGLAILIAASSARADGLSNVSAKRRAAAVALAIFPGILVHGIGAWTVGEKRAAKKLLVGEGISVGAGSVGGLLVFRSAGSPYMTPMIPLFVWGAGGFLQTWLTDVFIAAGGDRIVERQRALPPWSVELGTSWLHDAYRERALLRGGGRVEVGRVEAGASVLVDAGGDALIGQTDVRLRVLGPPANGQQIDPAYWLYVRGGERYHRDDADRVTQLTTEVAVTGRLDLALVDRAFGRTFAELGVGAGFVHVTYGNNLASEWSSELLGRFAWGVYLGPFGEASLFYEHTRDGLVGGLPAWRASGFVGSVGGAVDMRVWGPWAVHAELDIGNAYLTTFALSYKGGPR